MRVRCGAKPPDTTVRQLDNAAHQCEKKRSVIGPADGDRPLRIRPRICSSSPGGKRPRLGESSPPSGPATKNGRPPWEVGSAPARSSAPRSGTTAQSNSARKFSRGHRNSQEKKPIQPPRDTPGKRLHQSEESGRVRIKQIAMAPWYLLRGSTSRRRRGQGRGNPSDSKPGDHSKSGCPLR